MVQPGVVEWPNLPSRHNRDAKRSLAVTAAHSVRPGSAKVVGAHWSEIVTLRGALIIID